MFAAHGITAALYARERTGRGQLVDVAMLDSTVALLTYQAASYFATGTPPARLGNRHPTIVPYETFGAAGGEFVLAVGNDELWRRCCRAIGLDDLGSDPRFATNSERVRSYAILRPILDARLRTRSRAEWIAALKAEGVPCGSVRDVGQVLQDQQLHDRDMLATVSHAALGSVRVLGTPIKLSGTPGGVRTAPPLLGQHTHRILRADLGLTDDEIDDLRRAGVV
jgi:formyl-CoA transferase/CoA:oxalate CoA-transferase